MLSLEKDRYSQRECDVCIALGIRNVGTWSRKVKTEKEKEWFPFTPEWGPAPPSIPNLRPQ